MVDAVMSEYTQELYDELWNIENRDYEADYESDEVYWRSLTTRILSVRSLSVCLPFIMIAETVTLPQKKQQMMKPAVSLSCMTFGD